MLEFKILIFFQRLCKLVFELLINVLKLCDLHLYLFHYILFFSRGWSYLLISLSYELWLLELLMTHKGLLLLSCNLLVKKGFCKLLMNWLFQCKCLLILLLLKGILMVVFKARCKFFSHRMCDVSLSKLLQFWHSHLLINLLLLRRWSLLSNRF